MASERQERQEGAVPKDLEVRLRRVVEDIEAAGLPPHLEALARRLEAALAARRPAAPQDDAPVASPSVPGPPVQSGG